MSKKERMPLTHPDRLAWFRNVSLLGAGALLAAGVYLPAYQGLLHIGAVGNIAQAGAAESIRSNKLKKNSKKARS